MRIVPREATLKLHPAREPPIWIRKLEGNRKSWTSPLQPPEDLMDSVVRRLEGARSAGTWGNLESVWKQFLLFATETSEDIQHDVRVMMFLEAKLTKGEIRESTAYTYLKSLRQITRKLDIPHDSETLEEYAKALKRGGALKPDRQAHPASAVDIERALALLDPTERVGLIVAWKTCSRIGEIGPLRHVDLQHQTGDTWGITFPYHKGDPFRLGTTIVFVAGRFHDELIGYWRPGNTAALSSLTTQRTAAVLGQVNPLLSAHSVKRGALTTMLRQGVPLHTIQYYAKHRDLQTTLRYLPPVEANMAMDVHDATRCL